MLTTSFRNSENLTIVHELLWNQGPYNKELCDLYPLLYLNRIKNWISLTTPLRKKINIDTFPVSNRLIIFNVNPSLNKFRINDKNTHSQVKNPINHSLSIIFRASARASLHIIMKSLKEISWYNDTNMIKINKRNHFIPFGKG